MDAKKLTTKQRLTDDEVRTAHSMYMNNAPMTRVAEEFGVTHGALSLRFKALGLPTRPKTHKTKEKYDVRRSERHKNYRDGHPNWKGGRRITSGGYVMVLLDEHDPLYSMAQAKGYVMEHRYVMAQNLGRPLRANETVHHIDGNRANNDIDNLQLRFGKHGNGQAYCCADCGSINIVPMELADDTN